jgi:hypothetical protein
MPQEIADGRQALADACHASDRKMMHRVHHFAELRAHALQHEKKP